jgi:hypothetical protein
MGIDRPVAVAVSNTHMYSVVVACRLIMHAIHFTIGNTEYLAAYWRPDINAIMAR